MTAGCRSGIHAKIIEFDFTIQACGNPIDCYHWKRHRKRAHKIKKSRRLAQGTRSSAECADLHHLHGVFTDLGPADQSYVAGAALRTFESKL